MTLKEINEKLNILDIPVAYNCFITAQKPPFLVYKITSENIRGADNKNMLSEKSVRIELYSEIKNIEIEEELENLFNEYELEKSEVYIESEKMLETIYEFDLIIKR